MGRYPKPDKERHKLFTCSLPKPQFEQVTKASKVAGIPRSRFIQHAIAYFLAKNRIDRLDIVETPQEATDLLNKKFWDVT